MFECGYSLKNDRRVQHLVTDRLQRVHQQIVHVHAIYSVHLQIASHLQTVHVDRTVEQHRIVDSLRSTQAHVGSLQKRQIDAGEIAVVHNLTRTVQNQRIEVLPTGDHRRTVHPVVNQHVPFECAQIQIVDSVVHVDAVRQQIAVHDHRLSDGDGLIRVSAQCVGEEPVQIQFVQVAGS